MSRWYKGFRCFGRQDQILENLGSIITQYELSHYFPEARVEKGWGKEFYLFLAIDGLDEGVLPQEFNVYLQHVQFLRSPLDSPFNLDEIKKMSRVGAESRLQSFVPKLPYSRIPRHEVLDPFAADVDVNVHETIEGEDIGDRTEKYDCLLRWLSVNGRGTGRAFQNACRTLLPKEQISTIIRNFRLLGHVEFSEDGQQWSVAPTVMVQSDGTISDRRYFIAGSRHMHLTHILRNLTRGQQIIQPKGSGPSILLIEECDPPSIIKSEHLIEYHLHDGGLVSRQLATLLPPVGKWMNSLTEVPSVRPHNYRLKKFQATEFEDASFQDEASGMYEFWDLATQTTRSRFTLFYDACHNRWLRGDWYGLRFLALQADGSSCPVRYDPSTEYLDILHDWRWPELYERALVLASGKLPERNGAWLSYGCISQDTYEQLRTKLSLRTEE